MKTVVITDPLNGFGLELASDLARAGYFIIGMVNNSSEVELVKKTIKTRYKFANIEVFVGDFFNVRDLRQAILNIKLILTENNLDGLYALVCNRHMFSDIYELQEDKIEVQFFENFLINLMLATYLEPLLLKFENSRILFPTVESKYFVDFNFKDKFKENKYVGYEVFAQSKMLNLMIANVWNKKHEQVKIISFIDRYITSGKFLHEDKPQRRIFKSSEMDKIRQGIVAIINLPKITDFKYKYNKPINEKLPLSKEKQLEQLWDLSIELGHLKY